jgi:hypothetical protein
MDNRTYLKRYDLQRFTSIGPLRFKGFEYPMEDTIPDPGDNFTVYSVLQNQGQLTTAKDISASIESLNDYTTVSDKILTFDDIQAGQKATTISRKVLKISEDCPNGTILEFAMDIFSHQELFWRDTFMLKVGQGLVLANDELQLKLMEKIEIFPNPASETINIKGLPGPSDIRIYNLQGQLLKSFQQVENKIDLSGLNPGIYILQLQLGNKTVERKVVRQ